jgi:uncharacterized protein (TIGR02646 family)
MRYIKRLSKPEILEQKEQEWTDKFLKSGKDRPDNSKYGHDEIKSVLFAMSHHKCYYCEQVLKGSKQEIDHFIEVKERKDLAYNWENLYLACENCNNKLPNRDIAVTDVLNPCIDSDEEITKHLTFEDEQIKFLTPKGELTIKKYKLSTEKLDFLRSKFLTAFYKKLSLLHNLQATENRKLTPDETKSLQDFAKADAPFSLLFRVALKKYGLL